MVEICSKDIRNSVVNITKIVEKYFDVIKINLKFGKLQLEEDLATQEKVLGHANDLLNHWNSLMTQRNLNDLTVVNIPSSLWMETIKMLSINNQIEEFQSSSKKIDASVPLKLEETVSLNVHLPKITEVEPKNVDVIFLGNPGVGKSTLATAISGKKFNAGPSIVSGLTKELQFETDASGKDIRYADTAGLVDVEMAEKAAAIIEKGIKNSISNGREVRLVFVLQTIGGARIQAQDILVINKVLSSITLPDGKKPGENSYMVLFNQFHKSFYDGKFKENKLKFEAPFRMASENTALTIPTSNIAYFWYRNDLDVAENGVIDDQKEIERIKEAIFQSDAVIKPKLVDKIDVTDIQGLIDKTSKQAKEDDKYFKEVIADLRDAQESSEIEKKELEKAIKKMRETIKQRDLRQQIDEDRIKELSEKLKTIGISYPMLKTEEYQALEINKMRETIKQRNLRQQIDEDKIKELYERLETEGIVPVLKSVITMDDVKSVITRPWTPDSEVWS